MDRHYLFRIGFMGWMILLLAGCSRNMLPNAPEATMLPSPETVQVDETQVTPISSNNGDVTPMIQPLPTPSNPELPGLIQKTREDLAQRLSISITQINLIEAVEVEWSDSSLGCPQPGMNYLQVITPGYRILLEAGVQVYEYHSNRDTYFILCENQNPIISPPKP